MQCLRQLYERKKQYFSKISLIINLTLLLENLSIIILILIVLLKLEIYIQIYLLYCLIYSLIFILFIALVECLNKKNILYNKIFFTILSSYLFLTINIFLISLLFGALFYELKEAQKNILFKKYKHYLVLITLFSFFILITLLFNIIIFQIFKYFRDENINNSERDSFESKSTEESEVSVKLANFEDINDKIFFQLNLIDNISYTTTDSFTQTV